MKVVSIQLSLYFLAVLHDTVMVIDIQPKAFSVMEMGRRRVGNFNRINSSLPALILVFNLCSHFGGVEGG